MRRWHVALITAAGAATLASVAVWRARTVRDALFERVERRLEGNAGATEAAIERWIEERRYDAASVAGEVAADLPTTLSRAGSNRQVRSFRGVLHRVQTGHGYLAIWVLDSAGRLVGSDRLGAPDPAEVRAALASLRDGRAHVCDPFPRPNGHLTLCYAATAHAVGGAAVEAPDSGSSKFVIVLRSTPYGSLVPLLRSSAAGGGTERGRLVARVRDSLVILASSDRPDDRTQLAALPWSAAPLVLRRAVGGGVTRGLFADIDGRPVIAGARPIGGTEWAVVRQVDRAEIESVLYADLRSEGYLLAAVLLALGLGTALIARSERTRRLREVAATEARLVDTLRSSLDPVIAFDERGTITFFNGAAERIYGWRAEEVIGKSVAILMPDQLRENQSAVLDAYLRNPEPSVVFGHDEIAQAKRASGEVFPIEGVLTMGEANGQRLFTLMTRDIAERLRSQAEREQSLSLLRATLESTADGILVVDLDGRTTAFNRKFLDIWGIPDDVAASADDAAMIAYARDSLRAPDEFADRIRALYAEPGLEGYDVIELADGRKLERVSRPQRIGDRIVGRVWTFRDVTARELAAAALRRSEASARAFVERSPYGICRVTPDGRFMSANPALVEMLGYPSEDALLRTDVGALYVDPASRTALVKRHEDGEDMVSGEVTWRRLDGRELPVRIRSQLVRDSRGAALHYVAYVENLGSLRAAEQALRQAEKLAAVGQFVSGVAHELNNPLAAVLLFADSLLEDKSLGHERETVVLLREQASRARAIVRDLLSLVRGSQGVATTVSAAEVVGNAVRSLERQAAAASCRLEYVAQGPLGWLHVDTVAIEQVLTNLVVNAVQAAPGGVVRIHASAAELRPRGTSQLRIVVEDEGPGIPDDVLPRVFEPFFTTKPVGLGTGLGLSVSLGIAERHGGTLHAENREPPEPRGARLVLTLPLVAAPSAAQPRDEDGPSSVLPSSPTRRVLIVDDEAAIRRALARFFQRRSWEVDEASDGGEALDRLLAVEASAYDLVISDLRMPGVSGIAMHDRLADARPELLDRLAFSTGDLVSPEVAAFVARTECPVLEKPFQFATLDSLVERMSAARVAAH